MTKRSGSYNLVNRKKPKLDEDDAWGEDFDEAAIDRCFELASQVDPNGFQSNNVSVVPDYNGFKNTLAFSCSTQVSSSVPSTSRKLSIRELEVEVQQLKRKNEEKNGEIAVLRNKIKDTTASIQVEQQRTTNEWREKLLVTEKDLKSVSANLEFKNLEIANLKQQLADLKKKKQLTPNNIQSVTQPVRKVNLDRVLQSSSGNQCTNRCIEVIQEPVYPLKEIQSKILTGPNADSHVLKITSFKTSRNTISYLQNQQTYIEKDFNHKCPCLGKKLISLENIYPDMVMLMNANAEELNMGKCREAVHKVISVALILLQDLSYYLKELINHLRTEDIQQSEVSYLLNDSSKCKTGQTSPQISSQVSKIVQVFSILLLHNTDVSDFVCIDRPLRLVASCKEYAKLIPHRNGAVQADYYFLRLLLTVISNIGKYRLANQTKKFITSVIHFLKNVEFLENSKYVDENLTRKTLSTSIFKEIVFLRPEREVIGELTFLLKVCSRNTFFLRSLFKRNGKTETLKAGPKGVLCFTDDVCCFCVLAILLQNYLQGMEKLSLKITCNILSFIYNSFESSHWVHHDNGDNVCVCSSQLYKIGIEFVFRKLEDFVQWYNNSEHQKRISQEWSEFLNHNMVQTIISQITFNTYELIEKYIMVFSQYKEIEKVLKQVSDYDVSQLNTSEELLTISHKQFNKEF